MGGTVAEHEAAVRREEIAYRQAQRTAESSRRTAEASWDRAVKIELHARRTEADLEERAALLDEAREALRRAHADAAIRPEAAPEDPEEDR